MCLTSLPWERYAQAERFLPSNAEKLAFMLTVEPHWSRKGAEFWYIARRRDFTEYVLYSPDDGPRPLFDRGKLAASISRSAGFAVDPDHLELENLEYDTEGSSVRFEFHDAAWTCNLESYECESKPATPSLKSEVLPSPDGEQELFAKDNNLWLRGKPGEGDVQLTSAGTAESPLGAPLVSPLETAGLADPAKPAAIWSPSGRKVLTCQINTSDAGRLHLVQSLPGDGATRPQLHSYVYPLPGDENVPTFEPWIIDVGSKSSVKAEIEAIPFLYYGSPLNEKHVWWNDDESEVFLLTRDRRHRGYRLWSIDTKDGSARIVVEETSEKGIDPFLYWDSVNVRQVGNGSQVLWYSMRDGWGHLYLYDVESGQVLDQLTSGSFNVSSVVHIDEQAEMVYFTAVGAEDDGCPYFDRLYRASFDGTGRKLLTPEVADHSVNVSSDGMLFVDTYSRVDLPPITVVRDRDGNVLHHLERADIESLEQVGWQPPERFVAKARDGQTDVHGALFRPTDFDPERTYPIIDNIYGGPQVNQTPTSFADSKPFGGGHRAGRGRGFWHAQAIAELGFLVVMTDGLGMPGRSKAYHDVSYLNLRDAGLPDHVAAIRQLADSREYIDLDRVGIFGHSAGGYASARAMLDFPNFYKVCVSSAGNHDHRLDKATWVERYMGYPTGEHYDDQANRTSAGNLQGKLFLIHGEMDENVHPSSTLAFVDALIQANKDFDLLILPNTPHFCDADPYFVRRRWDYFVRHLLEKQPPEGYRITA